MDTYTVLLVDDEEDVIQVIMKKINWEGLLEFPQFCPQNTQPVLLFIHNFSKMPKI